MRLSSKHPVAWKRKGDTVRVLYDSSAPQSAKVNSFLGMWFGATIFIAIGVAAILIPLLTLWQAWKWAKRQERNDA